MLKNVRIISLTVFSTFLIFTSFNSFADLNDCINKSIEYKRKWGLAVDKDSMKRITRDCQVVEAVQQHKSVKEIKKAGKGRFGAGSEYVDCYFPDPNPDLSLIDQQNSNPNSSVIRFIRIEGTKLYLRYNYSSYPPKDPRIVVVQKPVYQAPVQAKPLPQAPVYQAPVYQAPVYQAPVYQQPVVQTTLPSIKPIQPSTFCKKKDEDVYALMDRLDGYVSKADEERVINSFKPFCNNTTKPSVSYNGSDDDKIEKEMERCERSTLQTVAYYAEMRARTMDINTAYRTIMQKQNEIIQLQNEKPVKDSRGIYNFKELSKMGSNQTKIAELTAEVDAIKKVHGI